MRSTLIKTLAVALVMIHIVGGKLCIPGRVIGQQLLQLVEELTESQTRCPPAEETP